MFILIKRGLVNWKEVGLTYPSLCLLEAVPGCVLPQPHEVHAGRHNGPERGGDSWRHTGQSEHMGQDEHSGQSEHTVNIKDHNIRVRVNTFQTKHTDDSKHTGQVKHMGQSTDGSDVTHRSE